MNASKFIGSVMIVIGTTIGVGMLVLPTVCAAAGFVLSSILMVFICFLSIVTSLMVVEINLAFPENACSFSSMAEKILGNFGKTITWISYLFLLYSIITVYTAVESSIITVTIESLFKIKTPYWINAVAFVFVFGMAVFWSTRAVDCFNRCFFSVKGFLLFATLVFIMPHVNINKLISHQSIVQAKYLWVAVPVFFISFCSHFVIPSLRLYVGAKPTVLKWIIILGMISSLIFYLFWLAATLGTVPLTGGNSFTSWAKNHGTIGDFTRIIIIVVNNKWVTSSISGFFNIAMTTCFLGVALSLFDFLADGFKRSNTRFGRLQTAGLTFIPPLFFALAYSREFDKALNFAAVSMSMLAIVLPSLMVYRLRKNSNLKSQYRMFGGNVLFVTVFIIGVIIISMSILANLDLLPSITS